MNYVLAVSLFFNVFLGFLALYFFDLSKRYRMAYAQEKAKRFQLYAAAAVLIAARYVIPYIKNKCTKS